MDITIIGTGNMARGIGTLAARGGNTVTVHGTEREKADELARELGGSTKAGTVGDPILDEVVVPALWYPVTLEVGRRYADQLDGKVVVDISNPIDVDAFEPIVPDAGSGAEELAAAAPGAKVVKAFNTTFAGTLSGGGEVGGQPLDVFISSDDEGAKQTVVQLVERMGLRPVDAGPLRCSRQLEDMGYLHMAVQEPLGTGFGSTITIVS